MCQLSDRSGEDGSSGATRHNADRLCNPQSHDRHRQASQGKDRNLSTRREAVRTLPPYVPGWEPITFADLALATVDLYYGRHWPVRLSAKLRALYPDTFWRS